MELTGKCKRDFKRWYFLSENCPDPITPVQFDNLTLSFKYGVYLDFFDSVGIYISIMASHSHTINSMFHGFDICVEGDGFYIDVDNAFKTRQEARIEAIKKANELYNENIFNRT